MADFSMNLKDCTNQYIADQLRKQLAVYDSNPLRTWRWWSGFLWGAVLVSAMNYGDVWLCVGSCSDNTGQVTAP